MSDPATPTDGGSEVDEVLAANAAFYAAFEARDLDAMSDVWEHTDRVSCVHPGWPRLQGWAAVASSWYALFDGPQRLQLIVTGARAEVVGELAWVTCDEGLLDARGTQSVAATNTFVRTAGRWRLVAHHGSPIAQRPPTRNS